MSQETASSAFDVPRPGSEKMPTWTGAELIDAPNWSWRRWYTLVGPGLLMGGAAIGGGEWLAGPLVSARFGGALLWLATLSILGQAIYNIEISRYTLYCGEPIFTGKFRTLPGPVFWLAVYLLLDAGSLFPYLAASAATPLAAVFLGHIPDPKADATLLEWLGYAIFLGALVPMVFGGKIYNALKAIMTFKIVVVLGFLLMLGLFFSRWDTWVEIFTGFFKFGNVPVGEGNDVDNVFVAWWEGRSVGPINLATIGLLSTLVAISGQGGLTNTTVSNYTRDQGWGMGHHVGAIPSIIGGHTLKLAHVGAVFDVNDESLPRWRRWFRHMLRDQLLVWMPACFIGLALPSMLSVQFLPRGTKADPWTAAGMTANGVFTDVTAQAGFFLGNLCWFMTLFCGFLVLAPSMAATADGVIRRWVDVFWTSSHTLRQVDPRRIRNLYFGVLCAYACFGMFVLMFIPEEKLLFISSNIYNYALGFSCWHTLYVNLTLLPRELKPRWHMRLALFLAGTFFILTALAQNYADVMKPRP
ncbi:MAG: Nramp family divalent metal transporter [Gemmataceae bacterium]